MTNSLSSPLSSKTTPHKNGGLSYILLMKKQGSLYSYMMKVHLKTDKLRMNNDDLKKLVTPIYPPLTVIITPAAMDETQNAKNQK